MGYPEKFKKIIESFQKLPGIGYKSAERLAHFLLKVDEKYLKDFSNNLLDVTNIKRCFTCNNISDSDYCDICNNLERNKQVICVIEDIRDLIAIEKSNQFKGVYHVLGGAISPNKGILPENLNIDSLIERAALAKEIILATNPTIEGETTALFLLELLKREGLQISKLAFGIPMGGNIEYTDEITISKSFENRIKL